MNEQLDTALRAARSARDWGNAILAIGIFFEVAFDGFWLEREAPFHIVRGKATTPLTRLKFPICTFKGFCMVLIGVVVLFGLIRERTKGQEADNVADQIEDSLHQQVVAAEDSAQGAEEDASRSYAQAANAVNEEAILERLISPRRVIFNDDFKKLATFKGTEFWIQTIGFSPGMNVASDDFDKFTEAQQFGGSFGIGMLAYCCGWKAHMIFDPITMGPDAEGVHIYSRRADPHQDWSESDWHWRDPYAVPLDTPERKSWAAAEALKQYLQSDMKLSLVDHEVTDDKDGALLPQFANFDREAVVIRIGAQTSVRDIQEHLIDRDLNTQ